MTAGVVFWIVVAALLFWSLGAHNRLVRLRAQVLEKFAQVDQRMVQALALLSEAVKVLETPASDKDGVPSSANTPSIHDGLQAAAIQLEVSLRVARKHALDASAVAALQTAYATVHDVWGRHQDTPLVSASIDLPAMHRAWEDNSQVVRDAATGFNTAVQAYNRAIAQFPASLLAYLFGFSQAAQL